MPDQNLRVENLTKTFGDLTAVDSLSLTIEKGEFNSLLGPSGCGKTTTLQCIAGIKTPDSGEIYIGDELVSAPKKQTHVKPENRDIGMVFQSYAIWPHMTVKENVIFPLDAKGMGSKEERDEKVMGILEMVGLADKANQLATDLSGGQQQRVAISRALVVEPKLLLFDEPLSNLDAKLRREMRMEIRNICEDLNITVLYVTHAQDEAMFLSDTISLMNRGNIVEEGAPEKLHTEPENLFAMDFMGQSNHYKGTVQSKNGDSLFIETAIGGFDISSKSQNQNFEVDDEILLSFRPKFASILQNGTTPPTNSTVLSSKLFMKAPTRDFTEYHAEINKENILIRSPEPLPIVAGDEIKFAIPNDEIRLFSYNNLDFVPDSI